jgi:hypothetical protein
VVYDIAAKSYLPASLALLALAEPGQAENHLDTVEVTGRSGRP